MTEAARAINVYTCPTCGWKAITRNLVEGVTPFLIRCEGKKCDKDNFPGCMSAMYRVNQHQTPTHEWYKPSDEELMRRPWAIDHVAQGGLLLRRVGDLEVAAQA